MPHTTQSSTIEPLYEEDYAPPLTVGPLLEHLQFACDPIGIKLRSVLIDFQRVRLERNYESELDTFQCSAGNNHRVTKAWMGEE